MIISTKKGAPKEELEKIVDRFEKQGDTSRVGITVALTQGVIVPSQETANLIGMIRC